MSPDEDVGDQLADLLDAGVVAVGQNGLQLVEGPAEVEAAAEDGSYPEGAELHMGPQIVTRRSKRVIAAPARMNL